jgi:hypothetical protein
MAYPLVVEGIAGMRHIPWKFGAGDPFDRGRECLICGAAGCRCQSWLQFVRPSCPLEPPPPAPTTKTQMVGTKTVQRKKAGR